MKAVDAKIKSEKQALGRVTSRDEVTEAGEQNVGLVLRESIK